MPPVSRGFLYAPAPIGKNKVFRPRAPLRARLARPVSLESPAMTKIEVFETFRSIQGESSYAGLPCFFIRLAGCNLACRYCDTPAAHGAGTAVPVEELAAQGRAVPAALIEITGGEPLLQDGFEALALALRDHTGKPVLVETNGSRDVSIIPDGVVAIVDVKCPGSGHADSFDPANLDRLRPDDELKFVISDRNDYEWARSFVRERVLQSDAHVVHFSPVHGPLAGRTLAHWILEDGLPVRVQLQLHRILDIR